MPGTTVSPETALDDVVVAGVRAAVLAPVDEVAGWFSWPLPAGTVERLVAEGRLTRLPPDRLAADARRS